MATRLRLCCAGCCLLVAAGGALSAYFSTILPVLAGTAAAFLCWPWIASWQCADCGKPVCWDYVTFGAEKVWGWTLFFGRRCSTCRRSLDRDGSVRRKRPSRAARASGRPWEKTQAPAFLWFLALLVLALVGLDLWGRLPLGGTGGISSAPLGM